MEYTTLGETGLEVSRIGLGCLSFGTNREWFLDEETASDLVDHAIDRGINFFDTANMYSEGDSERFLGSALAEYSEERYVLATKVFNGAGERFRNGIGLSRKAVDHQLAGSLERLGAETIDLYQLHKWDYDTPIEETLRALDDAVRHGQVRYLGASKMWAHQLAKALYTSESLGLERFVSMQNLYNLVYREEEREMLPLCSNEGIGVIPFSPLMRGYLARPDEEADATVRGKADKDRRDRWSPDTEATKQIKTRLTEVAADLGVSMAQVALAWLLHQEAVVSPVVGVTKKAHIDDAVAAVDLSLAESDIEYLEEPYTPTRVIGHG